MGIDIDVFGYFRIGASPSERKYVDRCVEMNRNLLTSLPAGGFWQKEDFRFAAESEDVTSAQLISVVKTYRRLQLDLFEEALMSIARQLVWSDGLLINRSVDRRMRGGAMVFEYSFENVLFDIKQPARGIEITMNRRTWSE